MKQKSQKTTLETSKMVLLVDDNPKNLSLLSDLLIQNGYNVSTTLNGQMALKYLEKNIPDLILLDIRMPEMDGFEFCRRLKGNENTRDIPVIFISALDCIEEKVTAFNIGGIDYVTKPFQAEEVLARVKTHIMIQDMQKQLQTAYGEIEIKVQERTAELKKTNEILEKEINHRKTIEEKLKDSFKEVEQLKNRLEEENMYLQEEIKTTLQFGEIIGQNKQLKKTMTLIKQVSTSTTTVLILGKTGTGKELVARAIHQQSNRKTRTLVKVNCAAIPANLIESELFGHEKGAFTGAISRKTGRFELADKGTIFLDEIGDLPLDLQAKLLRVLQEGEFERLGSSHTLKVDVRVIAATNRDLDQSRSIGKFRDDLFYRLNVFPIEVPTLQERKDDMLMLVKHFVDKFNIKIGKNITKIPQNVIEKMQMYHWPGNIRELENTIERAVILSSDNQLQLGDWLTITEKPSGDSSIKTLDELQKEHIRHVLKLTQGKIRGENGASVILGIKPSTLEARMRKLRVKIDKTIS
jgi:formate hydrogenlyase transcriptional activator